MDSLRLRLLCSLSELPAAVSMVQQHSELLDSQLVSLGFLFCCSVLSFGGISFMGKQEFWMLLAQALRS